MYWAPIGSPDDTARPVLKNRAAFPAAVPMCVGSGGGGGGGINYLTRNRPINAFVRIAGAFFTERTPRRLRYDGIWFTVTDKTYDLATPDWLGGARPAPHFFRDLYREYPAASDVFLDAAPNRAGPHSTIIRASFLSGAGAIH